MIIGKHFDHRDLPAVDTSADEYGYYYWMEGVHGPFKTMERLQIDSIIRKHVLPELKVAWHGLRGHKLAQIKITLNDITHELIVGIPIGWHNSNDFVTVLGTSRQVHQYFEGGLVQNVFPKLDTQEREFLINGMWDGKSEEAFEKFDSIPF